MATAPAPAPASATRRAPAPAPSGVADPSRPRLRVVDPPSRRRPHWSLRSALVASVVLVVGSLLAVAAAQAYLTEGQVRLNQLQGQLATQGDQHRNLELRVAQLENPSHVVTEAQQQGLTVPSQVTDLPQATPQAPSTRTHTTHTTTPQRHTRARHAPSSHTAARGRK